MSIAQVAEDGECGLSRTDVVTSGTDGMPIACELCQHTESSLRGPVGGFRLLQNLFERILPVKVDDVFLTGAEHEEKGRSQ